MPMRLELQRHYTHIRTERGVYAASPFEPEAGASAMNGVSEARTVKRPQGRAPNSRSVAVVIEPWRAQRFVTGSSDEGVMTVAHRGE